MRRNWPKSSTVRYTTARFLILQPRKADSVNNSLSRTMNVKASLKVFSISAHLLLAKAIFTTIHFLRKGYTNFKAMPFVRPQRKATAYLLSEEEAKKFIRAHEDARSSYYNYYTGKKWGHSESYDLCINSTILGIDETTSFIAQFIRKRLNIPTENTNKQKGVFE